MVKEIIFSALLVLFSLFLYIQSYQFQEPENVFPAALGIVLGILSIIYLIQVLTKSVSVVSMHNYPYVRILYMLIALVLLFVALKYFGFYSTSFVFYVVIILALSKASKGISKNDVIYSIVTGLLITISFYYIFNVALGIFPPSGIFI